jgi:hypothetical protein
VGQTPAAVGLLRAGQKLKAPFDHCVGLDQCLSVGHLGCCRGHPAVGQPAGKGIGNIPHSSISWQGGSGDPVKGRSG